MNESRKGLEPQPRTQRLSRKESTFLLAFIGGTSATESYLQLRPGVTRESAASLGCRTLRRIEKKLGWPKILAESNLGDMRLLRELEKRLDDDSGTVRMRATELLARLLGRDKAELTLHHDVIEIVPAPRPENQPTDDEDGGSA